MTREGRKSCSSALLVLVAVVGAMSLAAQVGRVVDARVAPVEEAPHLEKHMARHEVLSVDDISMVHRRSSDDGSSSSRAVSFEAFGESFKLHLYHNRAKLDQPIRASIRHENGTIERFDVDKENYLVGSHVDFPDPRDSHAFLYVRGKMMKGRVHFANTTYTIEHSRHHYPHRDDFDMIIYRDDDVKRGDFLSGKNATGHSFCGADDPAHIHAHERLLEDIRKGLDTRQNGVKVQPPKPTRANAEAGSEEESAHQKKVRLQQQLQRKRRVDGGRQASATYNTCRVTVVSDYRFYNQHNQDRNDATASMILHIDVANEIFSSTEFAQDLNNLGLFVHEVQVQLATDYVRSSSVNNMLSDFSGYDFSQSCLAHLFTRVDFEGGTLGLAWVGSPDQTRSGGLCHSSPRQWLNTGLTTSINYGESVPFATTSLVTSHEMGHNWGSQHDSGDDPECAPSNDQGGAYLMYPIAVSGQYANNDNFSPCSIPQIESVIRAKGDCFTTVPAGVCGNGVLEPENDEECDSGGVDDPCCNSECLLRTPLGIPTQCTPRNSDCCDSQCRHYSDNTHQCYASFELDIQCRADATCTGGACPTGNAIPPKPAGTPCSYGGRCQEVAEVTERCIPFCERYGAVQCPCTGGNECRLCCMHNPSANCANTECGCPFENIDGCVLARTVVTEAAFSGNPSCYADDASDAQNTRYEDNPILSTCDPMTEDVCPRVLNLPPGTRCSQGLCNRAGSCEATSSGIARFWGLENFSIDALVLWARNNIVGAVMIISFLFWVPCSCLVNRYDKKQREINDDYGKRTKRGTMATSGIDAALLGSSGPIGQSSTHKKRSKRRGEKGSKHSRNAGRDGDADGSDGRHRRGGLVSGSGSKSKSRPKAAGTKRQQRLDGKRRAQGQLRANPTTSHSAASRGADENSNSRPIKIVRAREAMATAHSKRQERLRNMATGLRRQSNTTTEEKEQNQNQKRKQTQTQAQGQQKQDREGPPTSSTPPRAQQRKERESANTANSKPRYTDLSGATPRQQKSRRPSVIVQQQEGKDIVLM